MNQFIVIDQLCLNENGTLVCKKRSGRSYQKAHFEQGDLDGASCAYSLAMVFNILSVFESDNSKKITNEHDIRIAELKMIRLFNNRDLYPNGFSPCDIIKMLKQSYSSHVTIDHTGRRAGIPLTVKECLDANIPVILRISYGKNEAHWIVAIGYAMDKSNKMSYLLTLDSRRKSPKCRFWNGMLNLDKLVTNKYGFQYLTDAEDWVSLDDAIIIKKK